MNVKPKIFNICGNCFAPNNDGIVCNACGFQGEDRNALALPSGLLLHENFVVGRLLGEPGGFGMTYLCWDISLETKVAIKELFPSQLVFRSGDNDLDVLPYGKKEKFFSIQLNEFLKEARVLSSLDHPCIVRVKQYFSDNNTAYFVMDYCAGLPLSEIISANGSLPSEVTIDLLWPIMSGLRLAHEHHILHRDIKPENIIITKEQKAVLIDFGNARPSNRTEESKVSAHSPFFSPPEQYGNIAENMGAWTDVYSLCAVMYYCLTSDRPADAKDRQSNSESFKTLDLYNLEISPLLQELVHKGMSLDISVRFPTIQDLQIALKPFRPLVGEYIWQEDLPNNKFGQRMREIHKRIGSSGKFPIVFNTHAAVLQFFWFFAHRMTKFGILAMAFPSIAAFIIGRTPEYWAVATLLILINALCCGFCGSAAHYYYVENWSKKHPIRTPEEIAAIKNGLSRFSILDYRQSLVGLMVFVILGSAIVVRTDHEDRIQNKVRLAITSVSDLQELVSERYQESKGSVAPTMIDLGYTFHPNDDVSEVQIKNWDIEATLAIDDVYGATIVLSPLKNKSGTLDWICKSNLPEKYLPARCDTY